MADNDKMSSPGSDGAPAQPPRVLLLSYHFKPDNAIGARRPTSLVLDWVRRGADVTVVAAANGSAPALETSHEGRLQIHRITVPPRLIAPALIALKRLAGLLYPRKPEALQSTNDPARVSTTATAASAFDVAATSTPRGPLARTLSTLKRYYHSFEDLIDNRKLWSVRVMFRCIRLGLRARFDVIVVSGPPMSALVAAALARFVLRTPLILDFRDVWADPWAGANGMMKTNQCWLSIKIERMICRSVLRRAQRVVTSSPGINPRLIATAPWIAPYTTVVLNGYDPLPNHVPPAPHGTLALLYCGSIYLNRNPFPLLEAARDLIRDGELQRDKVRITFAGDCESWQGISVPAWIESNDMGDVVTLLPMMPLAKLMPMYDHANVLINFAQAQREAIPAKTYEYMALCRDSLVLTEPDSSTAEVVRRANSGLCVDGGDFAGIRQALRHFYDRYVTRPLTDPPSLDSVAEFSRAVQNELFWTVLNEQLRETDARYRYRTAQEL